MNIVAGVDLGTASVKGVAIDEAGCIVRRSAYPLQLRQLSASRIEQDPDELARVVASVLEDLWPFAAGAIVGQINTHILVSEEGLPLGPAVSWADGRAAGYAGDHWAPSSLVSRVAWWQAHDPQLLARAQRALLPRDYVLLRLTGVAISDGSSWPDLIRGGDWRDDLPETVAGLLPALGAPEQVVGEYRGIPIAVGCMDSLAAVLGSGPTPVGVAIDIGGTSETAGVVLETSEHVKAVRGVITLPEGWWHAGPSQAGGRSLRWAADLFAPDGRVETVLELAAGAFQERPEVIFVPYLDGERMPLWNPQAVGGFVGSARPTSGATSPVPSSKGLPSPSATSW